MTSSRRSLLVISASLLILSLLPRAALAAFTYGGAIIDIARYAEVAKVILAGGTVYELPARYYPYPPPWMYIEAAALLISRSLFPTLRDKSYVGS